MSANPLKWLANELAGIRRDIADIRRRSEQTVRHGVVKQVDPAKGLVRLIVGAGADGEEKLSPWIRYSQTAGALKFHSPPSVGQAMTLLSPGGDFQQAVALPTAFSDKNKSPSDKGDEHHMTFGSFGLIIKGDSAVLSVGGVSLTISSGGVDIQGGKLTHDGKNVGSDHKHSDVTPGGGNTGDPI